MKERKKERERERGRERGREGKGREGKGREGKGREGKGREREGCLFGLENQNNGRALQMLEKWWKGHRTPTWRPPHPYRYMNHPEENRNRLHTHSQLFSHTQTWIQVDIC